MNRPDFLTAAKNALKKHHPKALCAFVAGPMLRGEATAASDIDIIVLYDDAFQNIHRDSVIEDGWPIEFFVHNTKANDFFIEKDRQSGRCLTAHMLVTGLVLPHENALSQERRVTAQKVIDLGPPPLTDMQIEDRRYFITDSIDDLETHRPDDAPKPAPHHYPQAMSCNGAARDRFCTDARQPNLPLYSAAQSASSTRRSFRRDPPDAHQHGGCADNAGNDWYNHCRPPAGRNGRRQSFQWYG